jgi:hypothetical protein
MTLTVPQKNQTVASGDAQSDAVKIRTIQDKISNPSGSLPAMPGTSLDTLKELLEKNISWSQVIYAQNKKILRRIFWSTIFTWIKVFLTVFFVILAVVYASSWYRGLQKKYPLFLGSTPKTITTSTPSSFNELLKILPLNDVQREQLKTFAK